MKFLSIYKTVERTTPPSAEEMAEMGKLIEEGMKTGWLVDGRMPAVGAGRAGAAVVRKAFGDGWSFY